MVEKALTSGMQQVILHFRVGLPFQNSKIAKNL